MNFFLNKLFIIISNKKKYQLKCGGLNMKDKKKVKLKIKKTQAHESS